MRLIPFKDSRPALDAETHNALVDALLPYLSGDAWKTLSAIMRHAETNGVHVPINAVAGTMQLENDIRLDACLRELAHFGLIGRRRHNGTVYLNAGFRIVRNGNGTKEPA